VKSPLESAKCSQTWKLPTNAVFKVNVDVAIFSSQRMCGMGVVIRDEMGLVVGAFSKRFKVPVSYKKKNGALSYKAKDVPLDWSISNCVVYSASG